MRGLNPRAWSKSHDAYCDFVTLDETGAWVGWFKRCGIYLKDSDIIVEFPTGLKDKNGKEIYEGDIVTFMVELFDSVTLGLDNEEWHIAVVEWNQDDACYSFMDGDAPFSVQFEAEVIGNIHKNPELLDKEEK